MCFLIAKSVFKRTSNKDSLEMNTPTRCSSVWNVPVGTGHLDSVLEWLRALPQEPLVGFPLAPHFHFALGSAYCPAGPELQPWEINVVFPCGIYVSAVCWGCGSQVCGGVLSEEAWLCVPLGQVLHTRLLPMSPIRSIVVAEESYRTQSLCLPDSDKS